MLGTLDHSPSILTRRTTTYYVVMFLQISGSSPRVQLSPLILNDHRDDHLQLWIPRIWLAESQGYIAWNNLSPLHSVLRQNIICRLNIAVNVISQLFKTMGTIFTGPCPILSLPQACNSRLRFIECCFCLKLMNQYLAYEVIIDNNENTSWYLRLKKKKEKKIEQN